MHELTQNEVRLLDKLGAKMNVFGKNLREMRFAAKLTQAELAEVLEVSRSTVNEWEASRAQPSLEMLAKIKRVLNTTYEDLLE